MPSMILSGGQVHKDESVTPAGLRAVLATMRWSDLEAIAREIDGYRKGETEGKSSKPVTARVPARISWRVGSTNGDKTKGMALAYIDARDVMERLDDVCGPGGWQCAYPHANGKTVCSIGIFVAREHRTPGVGPGGSTLLDVHGEWVWKADGAGDTDFEAEKGALSDAFKRAAVRWGIGRYLYDTAAPWVAIEQRGKSYIIKDSEHARLTALLSKGMPPAAPEPDEKSNAEVYTEAALAILKSGLYKDRANAVGWFNSEKENRRKHGLTQGHVDLLLDALNETYPALKEKVA